MRIGIWKKMKNQKLSAGQKEKKNKRKKKTKLYATHIEMARLFQFISFFLCIV